MSDDSLLVEFKKGNTMRLIMKRKAVELMIGKYGKELEQCKDTEDLVKLMLKVAEREGLQLNHLYEQK